MDSLINSSNEVWLSRGADAVPQRVPLDGISTGDVSLVDQLFIDGSQLVIKFSTDSGCIVAEAAVAAPTSPTCVVTDAQIPTPGIERPVFWLLNSCSGRLLLEVHEQTNPALGMVVSIVDGRIDTIGSFPDDVHGFRPSLSCDGTLVTKDLHDPTSYTTRSVDP